MISAFIDIALASGLGATLFTVAILVLTWAARSHIETYLQEKAKNLASKQDIKELTRLQEEVRVEFDQIRDNQRTENQLRLAVVEQRFQKHQEAHTLWLNLAHNVYVEGNAQNVNDCQKWWKENSLYLDKESRSAFFQAYLAAGHHSDILQGPRDGEHIKVIEENWDKIIKAGAIIEAAVNLPSLEMDIPNTTPHEPAAKEGQ